MSPCSIIIHMNRGRISNDGSFQTGQGERAQGQTRFTRARVQTVESGSSATPTSTPEAFFGSERAAG